MDIAAIRAELADVLAEGTGFGFWDFIPDDVQTYPAGVVNCPDEITYARTFSGGSGFVTVSISVAVSWDDPEDAQRRLDLAMSAGVGTGSLYDYLVAHQGVSWAAVEYLRAGNWRLVPAATDEKGTVISKALAADLVVKLSA